MATYQRSDTNGLQRYRAPEEKHMFAQSLSATDGSGCMRAVTRLIIYACVSCNCDRSGASSRASYTRDPRVIWTLVRNEDRAATSGSTSIVRRRAYDPCERVNRACGG